MSPGTPENAPTVTPRAADMVFSSTSPAPLIVPGYRVSYGPADIAKNHSSPSLLRSFADENSQTQAFFTLGKPYMKRLRQPTQISLP